MPYRRAWMFIVALIAATVFAFWRSYFGKLVSSPVGFHIHGLTASAWMLLLLAQSWTPHNGQMATHRIAGRATFVALPLFAAGAMGVIHSMAVATVGGDPFYALWGARLALLDLMAFAAVLYAAGMALRHRREVRLHAGYMLSTALPLVSPVLGRICNQVVPGITIRGPQDFPVFGWGVQLANFFAGAVALWLWRRDPRIGRPWMIALGVIVIQVGAFAITSADGVWAGFMTRVATVPLSALLSLGIAIGAAVLAWGWFQPATRRAPRAATS